MIYGIIEPPNMNNGTALDLLQVEYILIQYMVLLNGNLKMYRDLTDRFLNNLAESAFVDSTFTQIYDLSFVFINLHVIIMRYDVYV
tara:strand:+ start:1422 stop:1679 length:258 start_codon:yes stop_codon:yes gene_type:complete